MTMLSNICILILIVYFLLAISVKLTYFFINAKAVGDTGTNIFALILFLLSLGAILPRLLEYLF